jgi:DNA-directed RNA polymerase
MDKTIFVKDQREMVLHAIRRINPDFIPEYSKPELLYKNHLVNSLNEHVQPIEFNPIKNLHVKCPGSEIMKSKKGFNRDDLEKWGREQLLNELNGEITIKSILKYPEPTLKVLSYRDKLNELHKKWRECIISSFNRDFNVLRMEELRLRGNQNLLPYLRTLEVEQYADILLTEIRRLTEGSETYSPYLSQLYRCLGEKVEMRFHIEQKMKLGVLQKTGEVFGNYCDVLAAGNSSDNSRQCWQRIVYHSKDDGASMEFHHQHWPIGAKIGVGKFLYNILIRDLKLDPNFLRTGKHQSENLIPAFFTLFRHQAKNVKEELKPHPMLMKLYRGSQQETLTFDVNLVPMVCPPQPYWTPKNGGYLVAHSDFLRLPPNSYQQLEMVDEVPVQNLYPIFDALNQQQSVAWRINTEMLDLVISVFNKGGDEKLDIPEIPENLAPPQAPVNDGSLSNFDKFR